MDTIANMLTIIRNGQAVRKDLVRIPYSKVKFNLAKLLEKEGFLGSVETKGGNHKLIIVAQLKYGEGGGSHINSLKRVSKPGQRLYVSYKNLRPIKEGYGRAIISTPRGLLTGESAKKEKVGGEYICEIW